ncbi:MAG TPA: hypothetical protein VF974_06785 [Patescibacteria group bacterium]
MDDPVKILARELTGAIAASVAEDPRVEACRERARAAGFEMQVSLEAVIQFMNRTNHGGKSVKNRSGLDRLAGAGERNFEISPNDKRFLRALHIVSEEEKKEVE